MMPPMLPRGRLPARHDHDMPVTGLVPGMAYTFAGCCHPVPGDEIVGIVTTGKGVTIHGRDCQTLASFAATPERYHRRGLELRDPRQDRRRREGRWPYRAASA